MVDVNINSVTEENKKDQSMSLLRDRQSFRIVREYDNTLHKIAAMVEVVWYKMLLY